MIPYGRQSITEDDIREVTQVLRSDFITQGPVVPLFEKSVTDFCGANYGVAVSSGTAALHLALRGLGVGHGDLVWTTPITFVASANAARYCGAQVDFVDIDPATANMCPTVLEEKCLSAERSGRFPKVVIPVHFAGQSCDMKAIARLAKRFGFKVLEDAAHALGGVYAGRPIGGCEYSDATIFSFHPVKIVTTGEGGMVTTNCAELAGRIERLRSHGITRDTNLMRSNCRDPWYYEQIELGYHYRMTDLQAALGRSQMRKLPKFAMRRRELAANYQTKINGLPLNPLVQVDGQISGWHLFVICLADGIDRRVVFKRMMKLGIGVNVHYIPVYKQPDYEQFNLDEKNYPCAERYYQGCLTLPLHPSMTDNQQQEVIKALRLSTSS